mmetsp:Transcript_95744/g.310231  ORF Transcript_95744/g.310231 Transcript_95744/m.310231 type:complete len:462 (+) Transcript_95744:987-2372(+)
MVRKQHQREGHREAHAREGHATTHQCEHQAVEGLRYCGVPCAQNNYVPSQAENETTVAYGGERAGVLARESDDEQLREQSRRVARVPIDATKRHRAAEERADETPGGLLEDGACSGQEAENARQQSPHRVLLDVGQLLAHGYEANRGDVRGEGQPKRILEKPPGPCLKRRRTGTLQDRLCGVRHEVLRVVACVCEEGTRLLEGAAHQQRRCRGLVGQVPDAGGLQGLEQLADQAREPLQGQGRRHRPDNLVGAHVPHALRVHDIFGAKPHPIVAHNLMELVSGSLQRLDRLQNGGRRLGIGSAAAPGRHLAQRGHDAEAEALELEGHGLPKQLLVPIGIAVLECFKQTRLHCISPGKPGPQVGQCLLFGFIGPPLCIPSADGCFVGHDALAQRLYPLTHLLPVHAPREQVRQGPLRREEQLFQTSSQRRVHFGDAEGIPSTQHGGDQQMREHSTNAAGRED